MSPKIVFVQNWLDSRVTEMYDNSHCMEYLSEGVWFHNRLNLVIVVNEELQNSLKHL